MAKPKYDLVNGLKFAPGFKYENILSVLEYKPADDDIFIVTFPKCGTTWTQQIVVLLQNNGQLPEDGMKRHSPFLELHGINVIKELQRPYSLKTHIEAGAHPWNPKAKYIIVFRNPKDAVVSFFYHQTSDNLYGIEGMPFNDFFEHWMNGEIECGSYFDWVTSWWSRRMLENVLIITYEDMKFNPIKEITKIAKFLDVEFMEHIIKSTMEQSTFDSMKINISKEYGPKFMRKGIVGDWKNYLNDEQNKRIEQLFHEKFNGTGLEHLWDNYEILKNVN